MPLENEAGRQVFVDGNGLENGRNFTGAPVG